MNLALKSNNTSKPDVKQNEVDPKAKNTESSSLSKCNDPKGKTNESKSKRVTKSFGEELSKPDSVNILPKSNPKNRKKTEAKANSSKENPRIIESNHK